MVAAGGCQKSLQKYRRETRMRSTEAVIARNAQAYSQAFARSAMFTALIASALAASTLRSGAEEQSPLRLCADPTNLPFSSDNPSQPGLYLEIGQAIAQALGRPVTYDWYKSYFGKRAVRVTLLGKQCDAMVGLPPFDDFMGPAVIFSKKFATEAYALVSAKDQTIAGIDDLKGKRVAVQYETTPQNLLAERDDIEKVTVLTPEEGMKALDQGKADVAFIWGPVAGWLNKTSYRDRYRIHLTAGSGLSWDTAIGFAKTSGELRDQVDAVLPLLAHTIADLAMKYGLPTDPPTEFEATGSAIKLISADAAVQVAVHAESAPTPASATPAVTASLTVADATSAGPNAEQVSAGKEIFNGTCAHCHGPDAVQSERRIDLRLLHNRYGDDMRTTFWTTVHEGRPAKGMPPWKEVFTDDQFESIYTFLLTIQTPGDPTN
jgi:polar amino acid transport system substrate-binding protein